VLSRDGIALPREEIGLIAYYFPLTEPARPGAQSSEWVATATSCPTEGKPEKHFRETELRPGMCHEGVPACPKSLYEDKGKS